MSTNGKGSSRRGWDRKSREAYESGWERIFRKNKARERRTKAKPS